MPGQFLPQLADTVGIFGHSDDLIAARHKLPDSLVLGKLPVPADAGRRFVLFEIFGYVLVHGVVDEFSHQLSPPLRARLQGGSPIGEPPELFPKFVRESLFPGAEFIGAEGSQLALQGVLSPFILVARGLIDKCVQAGARESRGEYGAADGNLPGAPS